MYKTAGYKIRKEPMDSPKYVDYMDKKRIESAFYNPKSKPETWAGMISWVEKNRKYWIFLALTPLVVTEFHYSQEKSYLISNEVR